MFLLELPRSSGLPLESKHTAIGFNRSLSMRAKKSGNKREIINEFGYGALNTRNTLEVKKGLVFAYWDKPRKQKNEGTPKQMQSPIIFQLVSLNLITCTSIALLIVLSRGLSILGLI